MSSTTLGERERLFDALAPTYDEHFTMPHRKAYDDLAWEWVEPLLPARPGVVVDAGCGVGRWAPRLVERGHHVIGIEDAPAMAELARRRAAAMAGAFEVVERSMAEVDLPAGSVDAVIAMGSLQYTPQPRDVVARFAAWLRPGGVVAVLVDSLLAMTMEYLRDGRADDAVAMAVERRGTWRHDGAAAPLHLLDREQLTTLLREAGFTDLRAHGLLVTAGVVGVPALLDALRDDHDAQLARERRLSALPHLADLGKQLLITGRRR